MFSDGPSLNTSLIIIAAYLLLTLGIGLYAARSVKTLADYILAGRTLPLWLVMPTTFALWFGAETIIGASGAIATQGIGWDVMVDPIGAAMALMIYGLFFARPLYRTGNLTIMDFYVDRYGYPTGMIASAITAPSYTFWVGGQLFAFGLVLDHLFHIGLYPSIMIGSILIIFYTFRGGLIAITITEFIEMIVLVACLTFAFFMMTNEIGLSTAVNRFVDDGMADVFASVRPETSSSGRWTLGLLEFMALLLAVGAGSLPSQDLYERANSGKTETVGAWGMMGGSIMYLVFGAIPLLMGVMAYDYFGPENVHAMEDNLIFNLVDEFGGWAAIAFYAALISALLSTASASILAPSVLISMNILKPLMPGRTDRQYLRMTRYVVAVFAVFSMLLALTEIGIHDLVEIASAITLVSVVVPLTAGLYWKRATRRGAIWAMASGLSVYLLLSLLSLYQSTQGIGMQGGQPLSDWAGYAWLVDASGSADLGWFLPPSMMGLFTSIIAMAIGSLWPRKRG